MTAKARMTLLRQRAWVRCMAAPTPYVPAGLFRAKHPQAGVPRRNGGVGQLRSPRSPVSHIPFGPVLSPDVPPWVKVPDPSDPVQVVCKRRKGIPALVKIAARLLRKPKRGEKYEP